MGSFLKLTIIFRELEEYKTYINISNKEYYGKQYYKKWIWSDWPQGKAKNFDHWVLYI